jgi:hypothetical protein
MDSVPLVKETVLDLPNLPRNGLIQSASSDVPM